MKKIALVLLLLFSILKADFLYEIPLLDYAELVAASNRVNILISKDLQSKSISFFFPSDPKPYTHLKAFKALLNEQGLYLADYGSFYMVKALKDKIVKNDYFSYHMKYLNFDDVKKLLSIYDVKYAYLSNSNTLVFFTSLDVFQKIKKFLDHIDKPKNQLPVRITIFFTDLSKLSDIGSHIDQFGFSLEDSISFLFPNGSSNILSGNNVLRFKSLIKFLVDHGYSQVIQKPSVLLRDNEKVTFKVVKTIPFLVSKQIITNNQSRSIDSYEYKDVGLTLSIKPKIFSRFVVLNLDLLLENIVSLSDRPITSKIFLNNSFKLNRNQILVLSGFIQSDKKSYRSGVPLLKDIPLIKYIFSYQKDSLANYLLSIFIQIV